MIINKHLSFGSILEIKHQVLSDLQSTDRESFSTDESEGILSGLLTLKKNLSEDEFQKDKVIVSKGKNPYAHDAYTISLRHGNTTKKQPVRQFPTAEIIQTTLLELRRLFNIDEMKKKIS